jgi:PAS domain S-box-containing protein
MRRGDKPVRAGRNPAKTKARVDAESARLRKALKTETARRRQAEKSLADALQQQAATSEILGVISQSPTDVQPVFDTIVRRAVTLCGGMFGNVQRFDGQLMHLVAHHGYDPEGLAAYRQMYPMPPRRTQTASRAVLTGSVVHVPDVLEDPEYAHDLARAAGFRSLVSVPMFRGGDPIGVITVAGPEPKPFPDRQIALLKTFADQAVIAIENVRLFTELQEKNSALTAAHARVTEALEQQTATAGILRVISSSPTNLEPVAQAIADSAGRLCDCAYSAVFRFDGELIHWVAARAASAAQQATLRDLWPRPPDATTLMGRTLLARETLHVHDAAADPTYPGYGALAIRSFLGVPMLRDGQPIGGIGLVRTVVRPFSEREIALVRTFADQAVIAIENVRLFNELESRNRALSESLEQQTATSEILRVISSSPTDVQPVLDAVAENGARLCEATDAQIFRVEGDFLRRVASFGSIPAHTGRPISRGWVTGRSVVDRRTVHVHDLAAESEGEFPVGRETQKLFGHRTTLATPLLREGQPLGAILIRRMEVRPFSDKQIKLLETFADQAVIAIENVRLFTELGARNRDLTEALEQQTATAEILRVISQSPTDVQPVLDAVAESAGRLCDAQFCAVFRFDGTLLHFVAHHGLTPEGVQAYRQGYPMAPGRGSAAARSILGRAVEHIPDIQADPNYAHGAIARVLTFRSIVAAPMLRDGVPIGTIVVARSEAGRFPDTRIALLKTFADQAVIAIENVRLFTELQQKNSALTTAHAQVTEALEQQTATSEILRVISSSPTDVQPVFDTIAGSALRLCDGHFSAVVRFDGELMHLVALHSVTPEGREALERAYPRRPSPGGLTDQAILTRAIAHVPDVLDDPGYGHRNLALAANYRSMLAVPLLREGNPIGVIAVTRAAVGPFPDNQIDLLKTFADQAVIAIENVRLFTEVQARNRELTEALEQQTATSEILRVISSSPTDVQPIFDAIARNAAQLCGAVFSSVFRLDGEAVHRVADHNIAPVTAEAMAEIQGLYPVSLDRGGLLVRAIRDRVIVHVPDLEGEPGIPSFTRRVARLRDYRALLIVPMLREGRCIGAIAAARRDPGPFAESQIELLKTFADQAVIAIENVRLFTEVQARNRELTEALEQQTATGEILRVISSSPTDVQPVFDTIAANARRLCGADSAGVLTYDGELVHIRALDNAEPEREGALRQAYPLPASRGHASGRAILTGRPVHIPDVREDPDYALDTLRDAVGLRTLLAVPMVREGNPIGAITLQRWGTPRQFSDKQVELLKTFADQAVIAVENVRLFTEVQQSNRELTEALEQQTATSEVLKVISRSAFDLQPVLETLIENAARLGGADGGVIYRFDGELQRLAAAYNITPEFREFVESNPLPRGRGTAVGRAVLEGRAVHIHDVLADPEYTYPGVQLGGLRTTLGVPMMREGVPIGVFSVWRYDVRPFADKQVELVTTFADQGAIAIENVRLFQELEARTRDLTRSVSELRALGEVSQAVTSSLDLETVLETIVSRAVDLSASHSGTVYEFDEATQTFHARATHRISAEHLEVLRAAPIRLGEGVVGRAGVIREPVQVADVENEGELVAPQVRRFLAQDGLRSLLAVPLVREGRLLGGLVILRREPGAFAPETVATLQTFAAQSVLAIHNAGLFRETQRQKQYSEALVQTSPVAIATMDLHGTVVGWNPGAERLFGYTQAEAIGRQVGDLVSTPEIREEVEASLREQAHLRETVPGERTRALTRRGRKDGTVVEVEVSSVPVVVDGAEVGYIAIYHDITELLAARREAEAANEAKSAFLATMSHEIRTPMNAVIGMSGLLLATPLSDEQHEYAEVIRQSGDALLTVINDILDFSKIEAGKLELESRPFDLRECVEGALDLVAARAAEKGLDLAYLIGAETPAAVVGDVTRLRQILLNLLSNAVKFTERGEVVLSVSAGRLDGPPPLHELAFTVRDTGIGIPPDRVGRLFQSFSQVDASTTRRYGGTGLGLAISQRLTELMGGRIEVTSEVGRGSEFRFTIRAAAAEAPVSTRRDLGGVQPSLRGKRVLAVDDNATNRRILAAQLESWGMVPVATGSPVEALGWIRAGERFDAGILDMHMPEMDGVSLARAMREHPAGMGLPLLLFTSLGRREARAESEGFAAYLHKPIKPSQLFDALASILADQPVQVSVRGVARSELDPEMARRHPLRILLAEDNVVNQKVALRLLGQMGYRADVAGNGLEAIDAVARQAYDVILMDVQMPEMDGFEASREINRRWPGGRRPRIVAMTANAMQGDRELCMAAGMDDYVSKPIRVEELAGALERCRRRPEVEGRVEPAPRPGLQDAPSESRPTGAARREAVAPPVPAGEQAGMAAAIDRVTIDRLMASMGREFVAELIDTFAVDARELIATLRRALAEPDVDAFRRAAHSLKSTSEALGATGLAARARVLETTARAGSLDGAHDHIERLVRAYEDVSQALGRLRHDLLA